MLLAYKTRSVELKLAEAKVTSEVEICVHYADTKPEGFISPIEDMLFSNGVAAVTIVPAPNDNWSRQVHEILIYNADTVNHTVTVQLKDTGAIGIRRCYKTTLSPGETLQYEDDFGWVPPDRGPQIFAPIISPVFGGTPTAPTPARGDVSLRLATTEFVNKPYGLFQVSKAVANQAVGTNVWTQVTFDTVLIDTENAWVAASNRYFIPKTGWWTVAATIAIDTTNPSSATQAGVLISRNGGVITPTDFLAQTVTTLGLTGSISVMISSQTVLCHLVQGDFIQANGIASGSSSDFAATTAPRLGTGLTIEWKSA